MYITNVPSVYVYVHEFVLICMYLCVYTHVYVYIIIDICNVIYTCIYIYIYIHLYMYMYMYMYKYSNTQTNEHINTCIYTYIYTYVCIGRELDRGILGLYFMGCKDGNPSGLRIDEAAETESWLALNLGCHKGLGRQRARSR